MGISIACDAFRVAKRAFKVCCKITLQCVKLGQIWREVEGDSGNFHWWCKIALNLFCFLTGFSLHSHFLRLFILCRHFLWEGPGHDFFLQMDKRKEVTLITSFIASILRGKLACDFCTRYTFYIKTITIFTPKYLIRIHSKLALNMTVKHFWKYIHSKIELLHPRLALVVVWWVSLASIFVPFFRFSCKEDLGHVITVNAV